MARYESVEVLLGKTLSKIKQDREEIFFHTTDGEVYHMYHQQDCCESVWVEDITGDLEDLLHTPLTMAEKVTQDGGEDEDVFESRTWTFYKFATNKGYVTIRWCGESNGYYSESVDFFLLDEDDVSELDEI